MSALVFFCQFNQRQADPSNINFMALSAYLTGTELPSRRIAARRQSRDRHGELLGARHLGLLPCQIQGDTDPAQYSM